MNGREQVSGQKENVLIQTENCSLVILPHLGGKIASIRVNNHELLQAPLAPLAPRTHTMAFDEGDASGWDECLPSVAGCTVQTASGPAEIPDHGDLWRVEWQELAEEESEDSGRDGTRVVLTAKCFSLPLELERILVLSDTGKGAHLRLNYTLTNTSSQPVPWSWAVHPLFTAEPGDRVVLPSSIRTLRLEGSGKGRLGKAGDTVSWPLATLAAGGRTDLSLAEPPESEIGDKLFAGPLTAAENWCALERPKAGVRIKVGFDPAATPYLGLWICHGRWPDRPGPKQTCVALEPATAPVDSLAVTGPWSRVLAPGESHSWPMTVDFELL